MRKRHGGHAADSRNHENKYRHSHHKGKLALSLRTRLALRRCVFAAKKHKKCVGIFLLLVFTTFCLRHFLFGHTTLHGGIFGTFVDSMQRYYIYKRTLRQRLQRLQTLGIQLPPFTERLAGKAPVLPQGTLAEISTRYAIKKSQLRDLEQAAYERESNCQKKSKHVVKGNVVPRVILQPRISSWWTSMRQGVSPSSFQRISFSESEMHNLIALHFDNLLDAYESLPSTADKIQLWSICALYWYGGFIFGKGVRDATPLFGDPTVHDFADFDTVIREERQESLQHACDSRGVLVLRKTPLAGTEESHQTSESLLMAFSPRHPHLKCVIQQLTDRKAKDDSIAFNLLEAFLHGKAGKALQKSKDDSILLRDFPCKDVSDFGDDSSVYIKLVDHPETKTEIETNKISVPRVTVDIIRIDSNEKPAQAPKVTLQERMKRNGINPGWWCMRCLRTQFYGSFSACSAVCPAAYGEFMCRQPLDKPMKKVVPIKVLVNESRPLVANEKLIPRIVHQTWTEEINEENYPDLARLQNTWKNAGWEHRFYTDESARKYLAKHFPTEIIDAYDSLIPGAYKADLFRYLVLLKDGGVYADVDVMLETTLDTYITPTMSFFAPRDLVVDYANENFCFWNGLIGAAPGHPFLVRAVERLVNHIMNRADLFDLEYEICHLDPKAEIWKDRAVPELLLSGPCGFGVAVNEALGRASLAKHSPGWLPPIAADSRFANVETEFVNVRRDPGDALVFMADKADHGAFRFTDVERNIIVASTDLPGVSKTPMQTTPEILETSRNLRKKEMRQHYSTTTWHHGAWGTFGVYADKLVNNAVIKLKLMSYNS